MSQTSSFDYQELVQENKHLRKKLYLLQKNGTLPRSINDQLAEKEIRTLVHKFKHEGKPYIDTIDIYQTLKIPGEQADRIMTKLVQEGVIRDD